MAGAVRKRCSFHSPRDSDKIRSEVCFQFSVALRIIITYKAQYFRHNEHPVHGMGYKTIHIHKPRLTGYVKGFVPGFQRKVLSPFERNTRKASNTFRPRPNRGIFSTIRFFYRSQNWRQRRRREKKPLSLLKRNPKTENLSENGG